MLASNSASDRKMLPLVRRSLRLVLSLVELRPRDDGSRASRAHFIDRGRRFRRDRGRRFSVIVDDHGSTRVKGFIVSQPSTMTLKR
jgi:hypothetical protein